jgi:glutathione S-transferase
MSITIFLGDPNYSSWSLRPWLVLRWSGLEFCESFVSLDQEGYGEGAIAEVRAVSPSGRVPALHDDGLVVWDSLAISEWIAEQAPQANLWPNDARKRAAARSAAAEMHSGFAALRSALPMNLRRRCPAQDWDRATRNDMTRLSELWTEQRRSHSAEGPYLFGARSIADAFFTPVATRLRTYGVALGGIADAYRDTLLADPDFRFWEDRAIARWEKPFSRAPIDAIYGGGEPV